MALPLDDSDYYQLGRTGAVSGSRGGSYVAFRVDAQGNLHPCHGTNFPAPTSARETAERRFREWAVGRGYEIKENVMTA